MRREGGCFKAKRGRNGAMYYFHSLSGEQPPHDPALPVSQGPVTERADPEVLNQVYSALLAALRLSKAHRHDLCKRGLSNAEIDARGYRSLLIQGRAGIARGLRQRFGKGLLQVPGFIVKESDGRRYITIAGRPGLLVPVRDIQGRIIALKVRRDDAGDGPRYVYLSSTGRGGPGPGSPVHISQGIRAPIEAIRVTEGELKADVAFALSGLPTISIPGVTNWLPVLKISKELGAKTVRLSFDADASKKPIVSRCLLAAAEALLAEGFTLELERWDAAHKGIDDLLAVGGMPEVLSGEEVILAARALACAPYWDCWPDVARIENCCRADVIVVALGEWSKAIALTLHAAGLPAGWCGVTPKDMLPDRVAHFAYGKKVLLLRGHLEEPDQAEFANYAPLFARDGASEIRQHCPSDGFFDNEHTFEEVASLWDLAEVFTREDKETPENGKSTLSDEEKATLARIPEMLETGGAEALFRDDALLNTLASLSMNAPAEFAAIRASIKGTVSVRDLDRALKPILRQLKSEGSSSSSSRESPYYFVEGGCICRSKPTVDGALITIPLCNFSARIAEEVVRDDGAERATVLAIEGSLSDDTSLPRAEVPAEAFVRSDWIVPAWGTRAVVYAGQGTKDHLRAAFQLLSKAVPRKIVYCHTGWRKLQDNWVFLHAGGAIGAQGAVPDITVLLPDPLKGFEFADLPEDQELVEAIRASLRFLDLGPDSITFPQLASAFRAVLGGADFSVHKSGPTGTFKSETAALIQQHFGAGLDARHLPANWSSTGNSLEGLAFAAKDVVLVVDDFCPIGSAADVQRYHREADRLFRGQGNHAGRLRMRADATLRPARPPRGLILSTGEDTPRGQSLRARLFTVEYSPGDIDPTKLSACQLDAASGKYAATMAGYIRWLAPNYEEIRGRLRQELANLREQATTEGQHARTPGIVADLALGLRSLFSFAEATGAITPVEKTELWKRGFRALREAGDTQTAKIQAAEPASLFVRLLAAAIASGRAHIVDPEGRAPKEPERWGWRLRTIGAGDHERDEWQPQGHLVGWTDEENLYLEPDSAHAEAQRLAVEQGESLPVTPHTLRKRLKEKGLLVSTDERRKKLTVRKTLQGTRRDVLHLKVSATPPTRATGPIGPERQKAQENGPISWAGSWAGNGQANGEPAHKTPPAGTLGQSLAAAGSELGQLGRSDMGEVGANGANNSEQQPDGWGDWQ
jgi:hypothetical protein